MMKVSDDSAAGRQIRVLLSHSVEDAALSLSLPLFLCCCSHLEGVGWGVELTVVLPVWNHL